MTAKPPSTSLRARLRVKIRDRIKDLEVTDAQAAAKLGFSPSQMSKLRADQDIFSLDRLIDAGARIGVAVRLSATRPYRRR